MWDLDAELRRFHAKLVNDLDEVPRDIVVGDQRSRQMAVRANWHAGPRCSGCGRGGPSEYREVDDRQDGRVRHDVDELLRLEPPPSGMFPPRETLISDEDTPVEIDDRLYVRVDQ